mgnify:CR=1 FL=1
MSKKHHHPAAGSGWPRGERLSPREANIVAIRRQADRLKSDRVSEDDFDRHMSRLRAMLRDWAEFRLLRPDLGELHQAILPLTQKDLQALLAPQMAARRSQRVRAYVLAQVLDDELLDLFNSALDSAATRAGSPDDVGALALIHYSIAELADGSVPLDSNPLLAALLDVSLDELHELAQALREIEGEARETGDATPFDDTERRRARAEAVANYPALRLAADRRSFWLAHRLLSYVTHGIFRASLSAEELAPLMADVKSLAREAMADTATASSAATEASVRERTPDVLERIDAFAGDPARDHAFRRVVEGLAAEAREAVEQGQPLASRLEAVAAFAKAALEPSSPVRAIICQGSIARLQRAAADRQADAEPPTV